MKRTWKRFLTLFMVLFLLVSLAPAAFAAEDDDPYSTGGLVFPDLLVYFTFYDLPLKAGESTTAHANVEGADGNARFDWTCSDTSVASIRGSHDIVTVTARSAGTATVTLTVTNGDGTVASDYFYVEVKGSTTPVSVTGGSDVTVQAGESSRISASVSGGSGSYTYDWDAYGDAALSLTDRMRNNAEVYAGKAGTGWVTLTVYDAEDTSNNDSVTWTFNVTDKPAATPPEVEMNRGSIDMGAGSEASLMLAVTGGSGDYEYVWRSDNSGLVAVSGSGTSATIRASGTPMPGSNTAEISAYVRDKKTGLVSNTVSCVVNVSGGSTSYDTVDFVNAGANLGMNTVAAEIGDAYRQTFGTSVSYSASVRFSSAGNAAGSLRMQDDAAVRAGTTYTYAAFQDMHFHGAANGSFSTNYTIVDGGNTITGTVTIYVSGDISITDAVLSNTSIQLSTYSSQYLSLSVAPAGATYTVNWFSDDNRIVTVSGSGNRVTVTSGGRNGSARIYATVTDSNGTQLQCVCTVTVYDYDPTVYYDPSITIPLGSDYYGTKLSDSLASRYRSSFSGTLSDSATIVFTSLGSSTYGTMRLRNGTAVSTRTNYTLREFQDMYFVPQAAGTYSIGYQLTNRGNIIQGTMKVDIQSASISVTMSPSVLQMAPYSTQYIYLTISPSTAYYRVSWSSSDNRVATVSGNNTSALVSSVGSGTATITANVTDRNGVVITRNCTVVVSSSGSVFNPSVATTLGIPYTGTGTSSAMRSQFQTVYSTTLNDNVAIIRFSSTGNNDVAVMRMADGTAIRPNTDYTMAQYVAMYTQPVAAGTFSVPYTLTYAGKSLTGTVSVVVSSASISTDLTLNARAAYWFSDALNGSTGGAIFTDSIRNTVGAGWSYLRFTGWTDRTGTLYMDKNYTGLSQTSNITPAGLAQLYFVPGEQTGIFSAPYVVYSGSGAVLASGTLRINPQGVHFDDVSDYAYYAPAVKWAVNQGVTSGTGGSTFSPDMTVTRGQAVTFLWRAAGQPKSSVSVNPFTDVATGSYYYDAVLWAVQQGITLGTSDTAFSPDQPLHRDQMLTFLCRANGGYAGGAEWSQQAVNWATTRGLLAGVPGTFVAAGDCPRSEVVYYLWKNYNG